MPTQKSRLSFVTLVRPLIVSGLLVYFEISKLLLSLGNFLIGSKTTYLTEDNVLSFLVSILIGQKYSLVFHKVFYWAPCFFLFL